MKNSKTNIDRRRFIQQTSLAGAGLILANPLEALSRNSAKDYPAASPTNMAATSIGANGNIKSRGYAGRNETDGLTSWEFERRPVGDNDILIEIKYSGICHSDIHTIEGHWGKQQYPQVPGHEIAGIVTAVGKNVTRFKVGDKAGVGCMVDSCMECDSCKHGEEHHCDNEATVFTYGFPEASSPTGISQGGYANNIVVKDHFAIKIPDNIDLQHAAPLLCAGITTYSPLIRANFKRGDKVGIAGIGGLGHIAIKLAVSKGAEVYAFTTSPSKVDDIKKFGAKEVIVVDSLDKLKPYKRKLDYLLTTIPYDFNMAEYASIVKPYGTLTHVGVPINGNVTLNFLRLNALRVNVNASLIGGIPETQEVVNYCAANNLLPEIQIIKADEINDAWEKVVNKQARYRYVIDGATF